MIKWIAISNFATVGSNNGFALVLLVIRLPIPALTNYKMALLFGTAAVPKNGEAVYSL